MTLARPTTHRIGLLKRGLRSLALCASMLIAACGGDDPTPPPSQGSATIGTAGGPVQGPDGVVVTLPAGALAADTTVRIARDSGGAPALPEGLAALGSIYAVTPHIPLLGVAATVSLPFDASRLDSTGPAPEVLVAQPGGDWESLGAAAVSNGRITALTTHFSWVLVVQRPLRLTDVKVTVPQALPKYPPGNNDPYWPLYAVDQPFSGTITMTIDPKAFDPSGVTPTHWYCSSPLTLSILRITTHADGSLSRSQTDFGPYSASTTVTMPFSIDRQDAANTAFYLQELCHLSSSAHGAINGGLPIFGSVVGFYVNIPALAPAPVITTEPQSVTVMAGQPASFTFAATSVDPMTITWLRSDDGENTWNLLPGSSTTYTLAAAAPSDDGAEFLAHVCAGVGAQQVCTDTIVATLKVSATPVPIITAQPQSVTVTAGQPASFTFAATSVDPMTITWLRSDDGENTWYLLPSTSTTYTLPAATQADNGAAFLAHVCSGVGVGVVCVDTLVATLTVSPGAAAPGFTTQPASVSVLAGQTASISASAGGTPPPRVRIYRGTAPGGVLALECAAPGSGTNTPCTYTTPALTLADSGSVFYAVADNTAGSVTSSSATVTVTGAATAPQISTQPSSTATTVGGSASFTVIAGGTAPLSYQWLLNGSSLSDRSAGASTSGISGSNASVLSLTNVQAGDAGAFSVVVSNAQGDATSHDASLSVGASPPSSVGACFGDASGWCYLQPAPAADSLAGLVIDAAAARVYAVGVTNGFTMRSSDRGNSWDVAWDAARYNFRDLAQPSSGVLIATGSLPVYPFGIFRSVDGGHSWATVLSIPAGDFVDSVAFADANVGIAVGSKVWRTTDGGASWSALSLPLATLPAGTGLVRPAYAGNGVFVVVADAGTFLRSVDRGLTWTRVTTAGTDYLTDIAFGGTGFGVATQQSQAGVLQTSDYGATWSVVPVDLAFNGASGVAFADANTVVVMGMFSAVTRSTDGGATWSAPNYTLAAGQQSWRVRFADASFGLAAGQDGAVARTFDGGVTWTRIAGGRLDDSINKIVTAPGGAVTLASVLSGPLKRSTDAGLTWTDVTPQALSGLAPVSFGSANVVMGFGLFGTVAISSDAGATWTNLVNDSTVNFNGGAMATATTAIAYGRTSGSGYGAGGFMRRTTDAGATWATVTLPTAKWLYPSRFLTASVGLVGGQDAALLRTTDAGATWRAIDIHPANAGDAVRSIARLSDTIAVLSTDNEIKRSTDGGLTWTTVYAQGVQEVAFRDASTGIAVGNAIATTADGGQTWTALDIPVSVLLTAAAWPSATTPVIGGDGGALLRNQRSGALSTGRAKAVAVRGVPTHGPLSAATIAATKPNKSGSTRAATRTSTSGAKKKTGN